MSATPAPEHFDVVIVGAGISGINAAYRLQTMSPGKTYAIIEGRESMGGTWDLFKYPGLRSDSDMFTLGFPFEPWTGEKSIADGKDILQYVKDTAAKHGIDQRIRFGQRVTRGSWSSERSRWTLDIESADGPRQVTAQFVFGAAGYYNYESPYLPEFAGIESFNGPVIHPQFWPEDLDYAGKKVVVIGSGATAVTLVPALTQGGAKHVTMLQRTPSYILPLPAKNPIADGLRKGIRDKQRAHTIIRWMNATQTIGFYQFSQRMPGTATKLLKAGPKRALRKAGTYSDKDFQPPYKPWDQRMCIIPNGDLFKALASNEADIVTDTIAEFTPDGIRTSSGQVLDADIVVTATGLSMRMAGGIEFDIDGEKADVSEHYVYRGCMIEGIPNLAVAIGYTNASWTLRSDLSSQFFCKVVNEVVDQGYAFAFPKVGGQLKSLPVLDLSSGYVQRSIQDFPKRGDRSPWMVRQNFLLDSRDMRKANASDEMQYVRAGESIRPSAGTAAKVA